MEIKESLKFRFSVEMISKKDIVFNGNNISNFKSSAYNELFNYLYPKLKVDPL